jgi:hypothetical protein
MIPSVSVGYPPKANIFSRMSGRPLRSGGTGMAAGTISALFTRTRLAPDLAIAQVDCPRSACRTLGRSPLVMPLAPVARCARIRRLALMSLPPVSAVAPN